MRNRRSKCTRDRAATTDVVSQLECSIRRPEAAAIGALAGGVVPWFARALAHEEVPATWTSDNHALAGVMIAVVLGCACFSALTVYKFGKAAFGDARKALGFVLALEGVMLVSHGTTSAVALALLIVINAIANGAVIALARDATCRQREADARRAATRARNRGVRAPAPSVEAPIAAAAPPVRQRPARPAAAAAPMAWPVRWNAPDDVIDAEIVSEERLLLS